MKSSYLRAALLLLLAAAAFAPAVAQQSAAPSAKPAPANALPPDVHPESLSRLPNVRREEMDELGKKMYDTVVGGQARSIAGLQGPYGVWLHSPKLAEKVLPLIYYLRYETVLGRRLTELGILVAARELDSQFEWSAHEPVALKEGLEPAVIDVVRFRKSTQGLGEKEALIITLGRELFRKHKVSPATYAHAQKVFGDGGVVDLAALMGDYTSINMLINTFDIQLGPDQKPLLPMP